MCVTKQIVIYMRLRLYELYIILYMIDRTCIFALHLYLGIGFFKTVSHKALTKYYMINILSFVEFRFDYIERVFFTYTITIYVGTCRFLG